MCFNILWSCEIRWSHSQAWNIRSLKSEGDRWQCWFHSVHFRTLHFLKITTTRSPNLLLLLLQSLPLVKGLFSYSFQLSVQFIIYLCLGTSINQNTAELQTTLLSPSLAWYPEKKENTKTEIFNFFLILIIQCFLLLLQYNQSVYPSILSYH